HATGHPAARPPDPGAGCTVAGTIDPRNRPPALSASGDASREVAVEAAFEPPAFADPARARTAARPPAAPEGAYPCAACPRWAGVEAALAPRRRPPRS